MSIFYNNITVGNTANVSKINTSSIDYSGEFIHIGKTVNYVNIPNISSSNLSSENGYVNDILNVSGNITSNNISTANISFSTGYVDILLNVSGNISSNNFSSKNGYVDNLLTVRENISTSNIYASNNVFTSEIDSFTNGNISIGNTSATSIVIGKSGIVTNTKGTFRVSGTTTIGSTNPYYVYNASVSNVKLGNNSLYSITSINTSNTGIGHNALEKLTSGIGNTAIGYQTLQDTLGNYNTAIGYQSGKTITSLDHTISIGSTATKSNQILIGNTTDHSELDIMVSGNVGINTTTPAYTLDVSGHINAPCVFTPTLDTSIIDTLGIGNTSANSITIGKTGITTTANGTFNVNGELLVNGVPYATGVSFVTSFLNASNVSTTNLSVVNLSAINSSFTNSFISTLVSENISSNNISSNNSSFTNSFVNTLVSENISSNNLSSNNSSFTNSFINTLVSVNISSNNLSSVNSSFTNSVINSLVSENISSNNLSSNNSSFTNSFVNTLVSENISSNNLSSNNSSFTNSFINTLVSENISSNNLSSINSSFTNSFINTLVSENLISGTISIESALIATLVSPYIDTDDLARILNIGVTNANSINIGKTGVTTNISNISSSNITATKSVITNMSSSNSTIDNISSSYLTIGNMSSTNATINNISSSNITATKSVITNMSASNVTIDNISSSYLTIGNMSSTNATINNISSTALTVTNISSSSITATNLNTVNSTTTLVIGANSNGVTIGATGKTTTLNGTISLPSSSIADSALTSNIPKLGSSNTFTQSNTINGLLGCQNISSNNITATNLNTTGALTIGANSTGITIGGTSATTLDMYATTINLNTNSTSGKVFSSKNGNYGIEMGIGTTLAYLDFHSSNTTSDYDVKIASTSGNSTDGQGTCYILASTIGFGTTSPSSTYKLDVTGGIRATGTVTSSGFITTSDYRIKDNVYSLANYNIDELNPVGYFNTNTSTTDFGFIAHEVQNIFPELVYGIKDGDELQRINYTGIIPLCVSEIKKLKQENHDLRKTIEELQNKMDFIISRIE